MRAVYLGLFVAWLVAVVAVVLGLVLTNETLGIGGFIGMLAVAVIASELRGG